MSPANRLEVLKTNCESSELYTYAKRLDAEEKSIAEREIIQAAKEIARLDEARKRFNQEHKELKKPWADQYKMNLALVRTGVKEVTETVYLMADHDDGTMNYYNSDGECVFSRPLYANEHQLRILADDAANE